MVIQSGGEPHPTAAMRALKAVFPPSSQECFGPDEARRTCFYADVYYAKGRFLYV